MPPPGPEPLDMRDHLIVPRLLEIPRDWESRTAFATASGTLTFAGLRDGMLRFGGWLAREAGVKPGDRVALCLPKTLETVQAIYGTLAAGATYVPLQFEGPPARLGAILASIRPKLLLTTPEMAARLEREGGLSAMPPTVLVPAAEDGRGLDPLVRDAPPLAALPEVGSEDLAVVLFTSGSTGEPKGVMVPHRALAANVGWHVDYDRIDAQDVRLGNIPIHYISPYLFYPPLAGCRVRLLDDREVMFPELVAETLARERATIWTSAVTALRLLVERGGVDRVDLTSLRSVRVYGEFMPVELLRAASAAFPRARMQTTYGATEAPDISCYEAPRPVPADMESVPIGEVQPGYRVLLCDETGREVPAGEVGEICAAGPAVALGYWGDPATTAARRFANRPEFYRTGDLGRLGPAGELIFIGRRDHMVKLRGNRFDLGEIEAALKRHPAVREAIAIAVPLPDGETDIVAVLEAEPQPDLQQALREVCIERLPSFARPARFALRAELPRLTSGKIDRQRLRCLVASEGTSPGEGRLTQ
jgi:amino acid adenylation domain-containing protein